LWKKYWIGAYCVKAGNTIFENLGVFQENIEQIADFAGFIERDPELAHR